MRVPAPDKCHVTLESFDPVTVAVNCCCSPAGMLIVDGETVTTTGGRMVTVADADFVVSTVEVAVTVTVAGLGTALGAVNRPVVETLPHALPEQPEPLTLQVTLAGEPLFVALNCC